MRCRISLIGEDEQATRAWLYSTFGSNDAESIEGDFKKRDYRFEIELSRTPEILTIFDRFDPLGVDVRRITAEGIVFGLFEYPFRDRPEAGADVDFLTVSGQCAPLFTPMSNVVCINFFGTLTTMRILEEQRLERERKKAMRSSRGKPSVVSDVGPDEP